MVCVRDSNDIGRDINIYDVDGWAKMRYVYVGEVTDISYNRAISNKNMSLNDSPWEVQKRRIYSDEVEVWTALDMYRNRYNILMKASPSTLGKQCSEMFK